MAINGSDLINAPIETIFKTFTDLFGTGFYLIPISVIGAALWYQKKDLSMVGIYLITTTALLGGGNFFAGNMDIVPLYIIVAGIGFGLLVLDALWKK